MYGTFPPYLRRWYIIFFLTSKIRRPCKAQTFAGCAIASEVRLLQAGISLPTDSISSRTDLTSDLSVWILAFDRLIFVLAASCNSFVTSVSLSLKSSSFESA